MDTVPVFGFPPDDSGEIFSRLLKQLNDQHQHELAELRTTIDGLRQTIARVVRQSPQATLVTPPEPTYLSAGVASTIDHWIVSDVRLPHVEQVTQPWGDNYSLDSGQDPQETVACHKRDQGDDAAVSMTNDIDINVVEDKPKAVEMSENGQRLRASRSTVHVHSHLEDVLIGEKHRQWRQTEARVDSFVGFCILANIILIFLRLEYDGYHTGVHVGLRQPGEWPDLGTFFEVSQHVFCAIFAIELICRLVVYRMAYFYSDKLEKFNIFDGAIVVFTCLDLYVISPFLTGESGSDLTVIRAARFLRLLRAMRVVRTFEIFSKLRVLFATVAASFYALMWSMVLLFITMLMAALVLTQFVRPYIDDGGMDDDIVRWMYMHYGTAGRSLWTMFEATFSGGWPNYCRRLVEEVSSMFAWFFAAYVSMVVFAMTRIITALFLKDTLEVASNDAEMMIHEKMREKKRFAAKLLDVFNVADTSGDGRLTWDEFLKFFDDPKIRSYMSTLELDPQECERLFHMLDDGDGCVTADEFVKGAVRLKGSARSQDVISMMRDVNKLGQSMVEMQKSISAMHSKLGK